MKSIVRQKNNKPLKGVTVDTDSAKMMMNCLFLQ